MAKTYSVVSMFSGCGGMDLGFLGGFDFLGERYARSPFDVVWANDLNPYACRTYAHNIGHAIRAGSVWDHIDTLPDACDVLIGGFPCQDISINGKRRGVAGERSGLYRAMVEGVARTKPQVFVAENVRGLLYSYNKSSLETVLRDFSNLRYEVTFALYKAVEFGVPQRRERVFIVGTRGEGAGFEHDLPRLEKKDWVTSRRAISDLETMKQDEAFSHIWSLARKSADQGGRILDPTGPSHTIRAECHGNNQFHYNQPRRISMREAARFQSFPDSFRFLAKLRETERMIGNAVPPVLAWHLARAVAKTLAGREDAGEERIAAE